MADDSEMMGEGPAGPVFGPVYELWESCLEKLKILNYDNDLVSGDRSQINVTCSQSEIRLVWPE